MDRAVMTYLRTYDPVSYGIARTHGYDVEISVTPERGVEWILTFPVKDEDDLEGVQAEEETETQIRATNEPPAEPEKDPGG